LNQSQNPILWRGLDFHFLIDGQLRISRRLFGDNIAKSGYMQLLILNLMPTSSQSRFVSELAARLPWGTRIDSTSNLVHREIET
jgi:hypothetical protein